MQNGQYRRIIITVAIVTLAIVVVFAFIFTRGTVNKTEVLPLDVGVQPALEEGGETTSVKLPPAKTYELVETYKNDKYRFSFKYPAGFSVREARSDDGEFITVENASGEGFQILITPFDEKGDITVERIKQDVPDLSISESRQLLVGESSGKGVAFVSDNPAWGGRSREVWFPYGGNLYQISTYLRFDALLQSVFGTWSFY